MKRPLIILGVIVLILLVIVLHSCWIILPIKSNPHTLTLVKYGYININQITLEHYVDDILINNYIMELNSKLRFQQPQYYKLPYLNNGKIVINIEFDDGVTNTGNKIITLDYDSTNELYNNGLLIYLYTDYNSYITINNFVYFDQYVYLISGKNRTYFLEKAGSTECTRVSEAPKPKVLTRKEFGMIYTNFNYKCEENKWLIVPIK